MYCLYNMFAMSNNKTFELKLQKKLLIKVLNNNEKIVSITHESVIKYIEEKMSLEDQKALVLLLEEKLDEFLECKASNILKAQEAKVELLKLLCNIEPNAGGDQGRSGYQELKVEWGFYQSSIGLKEWLLRDMPFWNFLSH